MHLALLGFIGLWLLSWATFLGLKLLSRTQGQRHPLTLQATWNKSEFSPIAKSNYVMGVSARGSFKRGAYGMNYALANGWVGDDVHLIIEFEAIRK